jgi:hypothetical protein
VVRIQGILFLVFVRLGAWYAASAALRPIDGLWMEIPDAPRDR